MHRLGRLRVRLGAHSLQQAATHAHIERNIAEHEQVDSRLAQCTEVMAGELLPTFRAYKRRYFIAMQDIEAFT